jgi:hypothetical protein
MDEHENNLRDLAAMFAMTGLLIRDRANDNIPYLAYELADLMMEARKPPEQGIVAIKKVRKKNDL